MDYLLIDKNLDKLKKEITGEKQDNFIRLIEQCRLYEVEKLPSKHPPTSTTFMGMAAANLSLAYLLTKQEHYLEEAKRWIFTAVNYNSWGYRFLVDVDLSASWLLYGLGLSYDWIKEYLTAEEKKELLDKLIIQGDKIYNYGEINRGNCWSTDYFQNHNWINYTGLLTTAYAIKDDYKESYKWIETIKDNFNRVFEFMPEDGSNYEGTAYWRYSINFLLTSADLIRKFENIDYFDTDFLRNTFYYRLYQSAPNWEENINFGDVHDRRSSHSISAYYKIASEYNNGHAQWLGDLVKEKFLFREAYQSKIFPGILPEAFLELIWYDSAVKSKSPNSLPLNKYFEDLGLLSMRSSWAENATHLSFKSSPAGGHKQWDISWKLDEEYGWRTRSLTHSHVDFNNFILIHNGSTLVMDEGFNRTSKAEVHNLITVDGTGCVGEKIWDEGELSDPALLDLNSKGIYNVWKNVPKDAVSNVEDYSSGGGYTHIVGESSKMYYPEMELTRNARHIINSEFGYFIIFDDLRSKIEHIYTWNIHSEKFAKKLENNKYGIINGNASLIIHTPFPDNSNKNIDETIIEEIMTPQRPNDKRIISLKTLKIENSKKEKNTSFVNVLVPNDLFEKDEVYINKIESHKQIGVEIQGRNHVEIFLFSSDGTINHKGEEIEGTWMSIVEDLNGKTIKKKIYRF
jgi:hypothetical protein